MLAIFFVFVLVCAACFAIGFSLGKKTSVLGVGNGLSTVVKSPANKNDTPNDTAKDTSQPADSNSAKSVVSNQVDSAAGADSKSQSAGPPSAATAGTYFVQVAAVSRQEDAEALVEALKKKQYPAFAANNSSTDKYYHVQVGPYADAKEADAMKTRLIADGYNPIVKK